MGLSGSGKSTIIRCLNRLIEPTRGRVLAYGSDILDLNQEDLRKLRRTKMSMVFQHFGLFPHRTVLSNVEYGLEISGMEKAQRLEKARDALKLVGLEGYEGSMPDELSGGMQQRVGLARALANDPEILLMDEAFSALDPLIRAEMQDELIELQTRLHKTIVFITHDLDEALKLGDRITILGTGGKVIQIGTSEEIVSNPADDYVRAFVQNVDRTKVITASAVMRRPLTVTMPKDGPAVAVRRMNREGFSTAFVVDTDRKLKGIVRIDDAVKLEKKGEKSFGNVIDDNVSITAPETPIGDLLGTALTNKYPICVVDDTGTLLGIVERPSIIAEVGGDEEPTLLSESEFT